MLAGSIDRTKLQFSDITVNAGSGLSSTQETMALGEASTLSVNVDDSSIEINSDDILRIKASGVTNAMLNGSITNDRLANNSIFHLVV